MMKNLCEGTALIWISWKALKDPRFNRSLNKFEWESFQGWYDYLKVTLPIASVVYLNQSFQEILTIFIGMGSSKIELAAHSAFTGINIVFNVVPLGISWTQNSYMGNMVGKGNYKVAQNFKKVIDGACLVVFSFVSLLAFIFHSTIINNFTSETIMAFWF